MDIGFPFCNPPVMDAFPIRAMVYEEAPIRFEPGMKGEAE